MAADQLSKYNPDGTKLGQDASDKISLWGATPAARRTSTVLATSLLSASSYVSVASNTAAIVLEMAQVLIGLGAVITA